MRLASLVCCALCVAGLSCTGQAGINFGPYSSSSLGNLAAGVGNFIPGTVPGEGQFLLTVVNTDKTNAYSVTVTSAGSSPIIRTVAACGSTGVVAECTAPSVLIQLNITGQSISLSIAPDETNCLQRVVYIEVPVNTTGTGTGTTAQPPSVTETIPASIINCTGGAGMGG